MIKSFNIRCPTFGIFGNRTLTTLLSTYPGPAPVRVPGPGPHPAPARPVDPAGQHRGAGARVPGGLAAPGAPAGRPGLQAQDRPPLQAG